jgi:hypothetical protein
MWCGEAPTADERRARGADTPWFVIMTMGSRKATRGPGRLRLDGSTESAERHGATDLMDEYRAGSTNR